ncbi:OPT oligopeptide transporter protein-domain-containing protein [Pisolithus albus]|nr:OPT oligopeptide transporter protein-domain-containing protein [Pisolithus albus]
MSPQEEDELSETDVQDSFHSYLKSSLTQAKIEHLLEPEILASAEADLMITGLDPSLQRDLARIICGFNPLIEPSDLPLSRIAADLRAVAIEILQRHTFQDRYVSDLQAALDAGRRGSNLQVKASLASLDHDPHMNTYTVEEEDDDESDAGDLFAFLPPSTADQQRTMHDERTQDSFNHSSDYGHLFPNAVPPDPYPVAYPTPTFDPYARFPANAAGPSSHFTLPMSNQPLESPPQLLLSKARMTIPHAKTQQPSRSPREKSPEVENSDIYHPKRPMSSTIGPDTTTLSLTLSMLEQDSRDGSIKMEFDFDGINEEDSPFPEVRASVSNIDDPEMPVMTLRMWIIGLLCTVGGSMNLFFNFRQPAPNISPLAVVIISFPLGKLFAFALPISTYRVPRWLGGFEFSLNPGPWNIKECVLVYIMVNVAIGTPYAINANLVAQINYGFKVDYWFSALLVVATQLTGFGLAGICRRFLVQPPSMVWPQNLVTCTLLNTLHAEEEERGGITRYRYSLFALSGAFFYWFIPGYLFQALSVFSWICWIVRNNVPVNQLFGVSSGLGMSILTFDWAQIAWIGSPLMFLWWVEVHMFIGFVLFFWIVTPIMYYTNTWNLAYFPLNDNNPSGQPRSVQPDSLVKRIRVEQDDIHAKIMRNYPDVPDWWYSISPVLFFLMMVVVVGVWHTSVPVWALLLSILLPGALIAGNHCLHRRNLRYGGPIH